MTSVPRLLSRAVPLALAGSLAAAVPAAAMYPPVEMPVVRPAVPGPVPMPHVLGGRAVPMPEAETPGAVPRGQLVACPRGGSCLVVGPGGGVR